MSPADIHQIVSVALIAPGENLSLSGMVGECPGFEWVAQVSDWRAGLGATSGKSSRLLLVDWEALGESPLETLRELNAAAPSLPFVVLKGDADATLESEIFACGAQD